MELPIIFIRLCVRSTCDKNGRQKGRTEMREIYEGDDATEVKILTTLGGQGEGRDTKTKEEILSK